MIVRGAVESDAGAIRHVHEAAFPTHAEADLVEQLVRDEDVAVSLVAEDHARVVGHVLLSPMDVRADELSLPALGLAPLAVAPDQQGKGAGSALMKAAIECASATPAAIIFLLGEPEFYGRFGFRVEETRAFSSPYSGSHFLALKLKDFKTPRVGTAEYAPAFRRFG